MTRSYEGSFANDAMQIGLSKITIFDRIFFNYSKNCLINFSESLF